MRIFEIVKENVNLREAAELYGIDVNRYGKALCPFHNDRHPSLYVADDHYYCFACGEHGDVIDFVGRLFQLSPYDAARKLMTDFHLSPDKPPSAAALHAKRIRTEAQQLMENERLCFSVLSDYARVLRDWKVRYAPQSPDAPVHARFMEACHKLDETEYYCLLPTTKGQKMLMLIGKGGEGKSRIGLVMRSLLGDSMNTTSIQKVESNRFSRADLENKLLMVDDDMDMSALPKTNYIKSIVTSECKMDMERKGVQSYQSQLYVRFLCFGNGALTALHDKSDGFFRRQIVLTTKDRPADRADDPFLVDKLLWEKEGIFLWCLEGLHRLIRNNYQFSISGKARENMETVKRSSNNVIEFLQSEGYIRFRADSEASSKAIYEAYTRWCDDNAQKPMSANRVSSELAQNERLYNVEATNNVHAGGKRVRGFVGIEVVNPLPY